MLHKYLGPQITVHNKEGKPETTRPELAVRIRPASKEDQSLANADLFIEVCVENRDLPISGYMPRVTRCRIFHRRPTGGEFEVDVAVHSFAASAPLVAVDAAKIFAVAAEIGMRIESEGFLDRDPSGRLRWMDANDGWDGYELDDDGHWVAL